MTERLARRAAHRLGLLRGPERFEVMTALAREGPAALRPAEDVPDRLEVAVLIPSFHRGSGGLATILELVSRLAARGHHCSVWREDPRLRSPEPGRAVAKRLHDWFGPLDVPVHSGFASWRGADVVVATGWETVPRALLLEGCAARAYLVQDYEPDFFPASAESAWAEDTYRRGLHHIAAGRWLAELLRERFGARASHFDLGVDHSLYRPADVDRRSDTVALYARRGTPRRAVPLGLLALGELHRRRDDVRFVLFGEEHPMRTSFPYSHTGIADERQLAHLYCEATVGISLSLTNYSRVSQEMMACGLPCVELDSPSVRAAFDDPGAIALSPFDPLALADAVERLLDDPGLRARTSDAGRRAVAGRTWEGAADQVERALREALADAVEVPVRSGGA